MSEYIVDTFGIVQDFADLHGEMSMPLYQAIMDVMLSRQREEIVRCKDCCLMHRVDGRDVCVRWQFATNHKGFCAWGERSRTEQEGL